MSIDTGTAVVIAVFLLFYLRLIILQRRLAHQLAHAPKPTGKKKDRVNKKPEHQRYSIVSRNRMDWLIAGLGLLLMLFGLFLNKQVFDTPSTASLWWVPIAIGGLLINFGFRIYA